MSVFSSNQLKRINKTQHKNNLNLKNNHHKNRYIGEWKHR